MDARITKINPMRTLTAILAALLAATLLAFVAGTKPAGATYPGTNGDIAFYNDGDVWSMNPDGTGRIKLTTNYNAEDNPTFSPDGSRIAYEFLRGIWLMNANGSGKRALTDGMETDEDPTFSPDGTRIAFSRNDDIWRINADGSGPKNLTQTASFSEHDPAYSPDGRLAYTRVGCAGGAGAGATCVYSMNADGSSQTNLTPEDFLPQCPNSPGYYHNGSAREPSWSPDGKKIAFSGALICPHTIGKDIWVMNADGSGKTNIIDDEGTSEQRPVFSPDGKKILFESNRDNSSGRLELYTVGVGGGAITRLTFNDIWEGNADWAPASPQCDIIGTSSGDTLTGTSGNDTICGLGGNDQIDGIGGDDILLGGEGNDTLRGASGLDTLNGGSGNDTATFSGSATAMDTSLTSGFARRVGSVPPTGVALVGIENLTGSSLGDTLSGSDVANKIIGGKGADKLLGLGGGDRLDSRDDRTGNDTVNGGAGTDVCLTDAREAAINGCE